MPAHMVEEPMSSLDSAENYDPSDLNGNDVVISGISCRLPESNNIAEFKENLMNGVDMVTEDDRRWQPGYLGLPRRSGKLKDIVHFDASLFGVSPKQANCMDPQLRLLLEVSYEAILDAGVSPQDIRGTRTGVFIGVSGTESFDAWSSDPEKVKGYMMTGCQRGMFANRLSYFYDFKGPSFTVDTACSSSLLAMDHALEAMNSGQCDAAVVGGSSLCLKPAVAAMFMKLGMLSPDGACKSFDNSGNGYCRSEGIVAVYLQKMFCSKRIYATLVHSRNNCDGNKEQGITFPSGEVQKQLLQRVYTESGINPAEVAYVEAHGTGTKAGDPQELNSITEVFCKDRHTPLNIGSVKSNMGHPEPASGLAAVAKVIVAMESQTIPANLHYKQPNPDIPGLADGRLSVVDKNRKWAGGLVGINSFGFGGTNVHTILRSNPKKASQEHPAASVPRLCIYSGRTDDGVKSLLSKMQEHCHNVELQSLLTDNANSSPTVHPYRGFTVLNTENKIIEVKKCSHSNGRPVWFVFSGMGTQWHGMGRDLMHLTTFRQSILRSAQVLQPLGVSLYEFLMDGTEEDYNNTVNAFVGIAAIQVALVDLLKELDIEPDGIVGHSVGELGCGYADGGLTAEQTVLAAYWRGKCVQDAALPPGAMAAVGLSWEEAKRRCPEGVVPACHNTKETVTVSGPKEQVSKFVAELKSQGIFAKEVDSAGNAFHSHYMAAIAPELKRALDLVIPERRPRSSRWVSSSIPEENWNTELAGFSSADYYVNNLVSPVLFQEALRHVPENAITIEIAPHALLQAVLKRSLSSSCEFIGLMKRGQPDNAHVFLSAIGRCFQAGLAIDPLKLYAAVDYPVPLGTPMLSPWIHLDHSLTWDVPAYKDFEGNQGAGSVYDIDVSEEDYLLGHKIDGRVLFPATGYLVLAWKTLAKLKGFHNYEEMPVSFKNVEIHRATLLQANGSVKFEVNIMPGNGDFVICESGSVVVNGQVMMVKPDDQTNKRCVNAGMESAYELKADDIYKDIRLKGYEYGPSFQGIQSATMDGTRGNLLWTGNWVTFTDTMLQMSIVAERCPSLRLPTRIKALTINPALHEKCIQSKDGARVIPVHVSLRTDRCYAGGVEILGLHTTVAPRRLVKQKPILEEYTFVPHEEYNLYEHDQKLAAYAQQCLILIYSSLKTVLDTTNGIRDKESLKAAFESIVLDVLLPEKKMKNGGKQGLLNLLKELFDIEFDDNYQAAIRNIIDKFSVEELKADPLLNCLFLKPALKTCVDTVLENCTSSTVSVLEVCGPYSSFPFVTQLLSSQPQIDVRYQLVNGGMATMTTQQMEAVGVEEISWKFQTEEPPKSLLKKMDLVVMSGSLHQQSDLSKAFGQVKAVLREDGFLLVHEITQNMAIQACVDAFQLSVNNSSKSSRFLSGSDWKMLLKENGFEVVAVKSDGLLSTLYLCRYMTKEDRDISCVTIHVDSFEFEWVDEVKAHLSSSETKRLWLVSDSNPCCGILGMVNCLRREPGGDKIRCVFIADRGAKTLSVDWPLLLHKDMVMNIYKDGQWGSYRHVPLSKVCRSVNTEYAYVNVLSRGDLSSLRWVESPLRFHQPRPDYELCKVHYASLNFRDIMLATGKLPPDAIPGHLSSQDCLLGLEVAGKTTDGQRVMGLLAAKGLATLVEVHEEFLWNIPEHWSFEEAASVPVVYSTAYYALVVRANIKKGMRVLIHSGSGGVGQAAIAIALHYGCEVFTTVGSSEKRAYLKKRFPQLDDHHFGCSRDTSFELEFLEATNGEGMDVVLNSLAGDLLEASIRLLARHGHFLEIGKFDLSKNTQLGMSVFLKNISFHGILLDALFEEGNREWKQVRRLMSDGIEHGVVQPLQTTSFDRKEIEKAFRFMAQGKHIGKVVLQVRPDSTTEADQLTVKAIPQALCNPKYSYIITGGLGGFGLELAQWLIDRGAKKLVLTSRSGIKTGFQATRVKQWMKQGVAVVVSTCNPKTVDEAEKLISEATALGPVGGLFHLAMVLKDGFMENQSLGNFQTVGESKVTGTVHLDAVTRRICPLTLEWFVVFSSVSCGRGNAGQANYGFANSVMERVCEARRRNGLPALAIQWGAIGDVGVVINNMGDNDTVVGGTLPQRLTSCLQTLDQFLHQKHPVVSSFVLAEKSKASNTKTGETQCVGTSIARILGVSDPSTINPDSSFADLGLDSLMGVEVKQVLERDLEVNLTMQDIRQLTMKKVMDMQASVNDKATNIKSADVRKDGPTLKNALAEEIAMRYDREHLMPAECIVPLNSGSPGQTPLFIIHPLEGGIKCLQTLASLLDCPVFGVQCTVDTPTDSIEDMARFYVENIKHAVQERPYRLAGYSFGCTVALEMCIQSGSSLVDPLILLDGSHTFVSHFTKEFCKVGKFEAGDSQAETEALVTFMQQFMQVDKKVLEDLSSCFDLDSKTSVVAEVLHQNGFDKSSQVEVAAKSFVKKLVAGHLYRPQGQYKGHVMLLRVKDSGVMSEDYDLKEMCSGNIAVHLLDGSHKSFIQQPLVGAAVSLMNDTLKQK